MPWVIRRVPSAAQHYRLRPRPAGRRLRQVRLRRAQPEHRLRTVGSSHRNEGSKAAENLGGFCLYFSAGQKRKVPPSLRFADTHRDVVKSYLALSGTLSRRFSHSRTRSAESALFLLNEMVNCSTGRGSCDFCKSMRARSWLSSYLVPHWPVCLLMISFQVPSEGRVNSV